MDDVDWLSEHEREENDRMWALGRVAMQAGIRDEEELTRMARFWHTSRSNGILAAHNVDTAISALQLAKLALRGLR